jgi:hypothetical protein
MKWSAYDVFMTGFCTILVLAVALFAIKALSDNAVCRQAGFLSVEYEMWMGGYCRGLKEDGTLYYVPIQEVRER